MDAVFPTSVNPSLELLEQDNELRQIYPEEFYPNGAYFRSPWGKIRYYLLGPEDGVKVAMIHGVSVPSVAYTNIARRLAGCGFRVLLYDLFGRGYSESPKDNLDTANLYIIQLALLLQYVEWPKARIVGFSLGGAITAGFASMFPHLVDDRIVFLASAGLLELPRNKAAERQPVQIANLDPSDLAFQLRILQNKFLPAFKTIVRHDLTSSPATGMEWAFGTLARPPPGKTDVFKVQVIHGTDDKIVPFEEANKIRRLIPQAQIVPIVGASHYLVFVDGHWEQVADSIETFFS
ncbi:polyketide transferase af380 family protein [Abortiporus biennis]